jgi:hypothetical protein
MPRSSASATSAAASGALPDDAKAQVGVVLGERRDGLERQVEPVAVRQRAAVDQALGAGGLVLVLLVAVAGRVAGPEGGGVGKVHHHGDRPRPWAAGEQPLAHRLVDGHQRVREPDAAALLGADQALQPCRKPIAADRREQLRSWIVNVEENPRSDDFGDDGRKDEEIRHVVDVDDVVAPPRAQPAEQGERPSASAARLMRGSVS